MEIKFSQEVVTILAYAREEAMRTGSFSIGADHLLLGVLRHRDNEACSMLLQLGVDPDELKTYIDSRVFHEHSIPYADEDKLSVSRSAQNAINMAAYEALRQGGGEVRAAHLLIAVTRSGNAVGREFLDSKGVTSAVLIKRMETVSPAVEEKPARKHPDKPVVFITTNPKNQIPS